SRRPDLECCERSRSPPARVRRRAAWERRALLRVSAARGEACARTDRRSRVPPDEVGPERRPSLPPDALRRCVHVEAVLAQKAHERHPEALGRRDGEAGRRADGGEDREAGRDRLLHDLISGTTAHRQHTVAERQQSVEERATDDLIDGVVPADVLAQELELARRVEETRGMEAAGRLEDPLLLAQAVRETRE